MKHLEETRIDGEQILDGRLLKVFRDHVRLPDGREATREYVKHPGACMVIAELRPGVLILERQYRYPVGRVCLEMPAGKLDPDESPLRCAQRELQEETGYSATGWRHVGTLHPCIGYSDEHIEIFLAQGLSLGERKLDDGEFLDVLEMSLEEAEAAVLDGRISDGKTIAGLFWARKLLV
ncbi:MAG: NUDIX hydrolase [Moraxellaceae bacterium]|nr:NUDIX hydrolase [Moraxellaceae bacterium]